ncbi:hypothetical protein, partial [Azotosporobacter soli]|uniref:hypothetical protein n=1 Tax=Azotosporobacter soli TaxID=3055040 RepID=UPI0031FEB116
GREWGTSPAAVATGRRQPDFSRSLIGVLVSRFPDPRRCGFFKTCRRENGRQEAADKKNRTCDMDVARWRSAKDGASVRNSVFGRLLRPCLLAAPFSFEKIATAKGAQVSENHFIIKLNLPKPASLSILPDWQM